LWGNARGVEKLTRSGTDLTKKKNQKKDQNKTDDAGQRWGYALECTSWTAEKKGNEKKNTRR